jgi:hypothetical protein
MGSGWNWLRLVTSSVVKPSGSATSELDEWLGTGEGINLKIATKS